MKTNFAVIDVGSRCSKICSPLPLSLDIDGPKAIPVSLEASLQRRVFYRDENSITRKQRFDYGAGVAKALRDTPLYLHDDAVHYSSPFSPDGELKDPHCLAGMVKALFDRQPTPLLVLPQAASADRRALEEQLALLLESDGGPSFVAFPRKLICSLASEGLGAGCVIDLGHSSVEIATCLDGYELPAVLAKGIAVIHGEIRRSIEIRRRATFRTSDVRGWYIGIGDIVERNRNAILTLPDGQTMGDYLHPTEDELESVWSRWLFNGEGAVCQAVERHIWGLPLDEKLETLRSGVHVTGGGALRPGLVGQLAERVSALYGERIGRSGDVMTPKVFNDPEGSVAKGATVLATFSTPPWCGEGQGMSAEAFTWIGTKEIHEKGIGRSVIEATKI